MMKMHRKLPALLLALALILAMTVGCSSQDTSWVVRSGEETIPVGVYLVEMMMGYNEASSRLFGAEDILKETIDQVPAPQYIADYAKLECGKLLAVRHQFAQRGLSLQAEDNEQAASYTDYLYEMGQSFYEANGVSKESVRYINDTTMMSLAVFNSIYGPGGEQEIPRSELEASFAEQYTRSQYILYPKVDVTTGMPLGEEEIAAAKEKAEAMLQRAQAGEDFPTLIHEAGKELNPDTAGDKQEDRFYDIYLENNANYYPPVYESTIAAAADHSITMVEDDYYFYILRKLPLLEGDAQEIQNRLDAILQNLKYDEYMDILTEWSKEIELKYNNAALAAYTPSKLKMTQEQLAGASSDASSGESDGNSDASDASSQG